MDDSRRQRGYYKYILADSRGGALGVVFFSKSPLPFPVYIIIVPTIHVFSEHRQHHTFTLWQVAKTMQCETTCECFMHNIS